MFPLPLNLLAIALSLGTTTGVLVHDMHIDNAFAAQLALPTHVGNYDTGRFINFGDQHTHVERTQASQALSAFRTDIPKIQPRVLEDKKHLLQSRTPRGHHAFDNYNLPIV